MRRRGRLRARRWLSGRLGAGLRQRTRQRPGEPARPGVFALVGGTGIGPELLRETGQITGQRGRSTGRVEPFRLRGPRPGSGPAPRVHESLPESLDAFPERERVGLGGQRRELGPQVEPARPGGRSRPCVARRFVGPCVRGWGGIRMELPRPDLAGRR
ncbi:hypothetical protein [Saccharopolyspora gloriosae]|uniref:hypothetical protein n=1 Tax=Saccharopolyspora gloriosae TaxID=455344 RepID=UPI001FB6E871|nr:hypothetical protein [Saccharopolyspora gloriosae]